MEKDVMNLFKNPVIVRGILNKRVRLKEMEIVKEVRPFTSLHPDGLGEFSFLQPLTVQVSYHDQDDQWCLEHSGLTLSGFGASRDDALISLKESLESLIIGLVTFKDDSLSEMSREIKTALKKSISLDQMDGMAAGITVES